MDTRDRHLKLLTETIEAVNSTLDLQEVLASSRPRWRWRSRRTRASSTCTTSARTSSCCARRTARAIDEMTRRPRHAAGRGDHRLGGGRACAGDARVAGAPRPALQELPEPARGRVRVDPRRADPDPRRHARGRAERPHPRAARVRRATRSSCCSRSRRRSRSRSSTRSSTRRRSGACTSSRRSRGSPRPSPNSLYLEESLEAIVKTTMDALSATGAALVLDDGRIAWPEGVAATHAIRQPLRWRGRQIGELVADRATPVHRGGPRAARVDRDACRRRARARPRGHARRARARDPPPRQEQPADGRVAPAAAGALDRRDRPAGGARALGQPHPRDRRGARAADRAARRGRRARRPDRPAAGDARAGRRRRQGRDAPSSSRCRSPAPARRRWRSCSPSSCRTRSSTAASRVRVELAPAQRRGRARDRRRRRRASTRSRARAPDSRSCGRSCATSCAARSTCARTAARAPRSSSRSRPSACWMRRPRAVGRYDVVGGRVARTSRRTSRASSSSCRQSASARGVTPGRAERSSEKRRSSPSSASTGTDHLRSSVSGACCEDAAGELAAACAALRRHVFRPERMPVARVAACVAERLERVECAAQRLAADAEAPLQLDEPRTAALVQQRQGGWRPAVVKEIDQVRLT